MHYNKAELKSGEQSDQHESKENHGNRANSNVSDFSLLPPEILLHIFGYLKKSDQCMKPLTETCKRFQKICLPRLLLNVDFRRINSDKVYPKITRAYKDIKIVGSEIDKDEQAIFQMIANSQFAARTLKIAKESTKGFYCKVKQETLLFIIKSLPYLSDLELDEVEALLPRLECEAIPIQCFVWLSSIRKLTIFRSKNIMSTFKRVTSLHELYVTGKNCYDSHFRLVLISQPNLSILRANCSSLCDYAANIFPRLKVYEIPDENVDLMPLFKIAPNVERIKMLRGASIYLNVFNQISNTGLRHFESEENNSINLANVLKIAPLLDSFTSPGFSWKR